MCVMQLIGNIGGHSARWVDSDFVSVTVFTRCGIVMTVIPTHFDL